MVSNGPIGRYHPKQAVSCFPWRLGLCRTSPGGCYGFLCGPAAARVIMFSEMPEALRSEMRAGRSRWDSYPIELCARTWRVIDRAVGHKAGMGARRMNGLLKV